MGQGQDIMDFSDSRIPMTKGEHRDKCALVQKDITHLQDQMAGIEDLTRATQRMEETIVKCLRPNPMKIVIQVIGLLIGVVTILLGMFYYLDGKISSMNKWTPPAKAAIFAPAATDRHASNDTRPIYDRSNF